MPFLVSEWLGFALIIDLLKGMETDPSWQNDLKTVDWNLHSVLCAFFLSEVFQHIEQQLIVFWSSSSKW